MGIYDWLAGNRDVQGLDEMTPGMAQSLLSDQLLALGGGLSGSRLGDGAFGKAGLGVGQITDASLSQMIQRQNEAEERAMRKRLEQERIEDRLREKTDREKRLSEEDAFRALVQDREPLAKYEFGEGFSDIPGIPDYSSLPLGVAENAYRRSQDEEDDARDRELALEDLHDERRYQEGRWRTEQGVMDKRWEQEFGLKEAALELDRKELEARMAGGYGGLSGLSGLGGSGSGGGASMAKLVMEKAEADKRWAAADISGKARIWWNDYVEQTGGDTKEWGAQNALSHFGLSHRDAEGDWITEKDAMKKVLDHIARTEIIPRMLQTGELTTEQARKSMDSIGDLSGTAESRVKDAENQKKKREAIARESAVGEILPGILKRLYPDKDDPTGVGEEPGGMMALLMRGQGVKAQESDIVREQAEKIFETQKSDGSVERLMESRGISRGEAVRFIKRDAQTIAQEAFRRAQERGTATGGGVLSEVLGERWAGESPALGPRSQPGLAEVLAKLGGGSHDSAIQGLPDQAPPGSFPSPPPADHPMLANPRPAGARVMEVPATVRELGPSPIRETSIGAPVDQIVQSLIQMQQEQGMGYPGGGPQTMGQVPPSYQPPMGPMPGPNADYLQPPPQTMGQVPPSYQPPMGPMPGPNADYLQPPPQIPPELLAQSQQAQPSYTAEQVLAMLQGVGSPEMTAQPEHPPGRGSFSDAVKTTAGFLNPVPEMADMAGNAGNSIAQLLHQVMTQGKDRGLSMDDLSIGNLVGMYTDPQADLGWAARGPEAMAMSPMAQQFREWANSGDQGVGGDQSGGGGGQTLGDLLGPEEIEALASLSAFTENAGLPERKGIQTSDTSVPPEVLANTTLDELGTLPWIVRKAVQDPEVLKAVQELLGGLR